MAIYQYTCMECDRSIEINRPMSDPENAPSCEGCGNKMIRSYTIPSVQFKGSGFYTTDK